MKLDNPEAREQMLKRLRRIEGQARGVQTMISEGRDCAEILQQMAAIRAAAQGATLAFLESYVSACMLERPLESRAEREALMHDLLAVLGKAPL